MEAARVIVLCKYVCVSRGRRARTCGTMLNTQIVHSLMVLCAKQNWTLKTSKWR